MRFTCDGCGAQYMISDDKVGPGGVKVRCKRCSHVILVRPAQAAPPVLEPAPAPPAEPPPPAPTSRPSGESGLDDELGQAFDNAFGDGERPAAAPAEAPAPPPGDSAATPAPAEPPAPAPDEVEWYVAVSDAQVGPLLPAGVKARWESGEIGPDTLVWRSGMADWSPLSSVGELAQYLAPFPRAAPRPATRAAAASAPAEQAGPSAPEPSRDVAGEWRPAAASALAQLASEELAALSRPEPARAAPAPASSLVDSLGLPEGGVDPTGMMPLHLKGVDSTGETLLSAKAEPRRESTEVREIRKKGNRKVLVAVVVTALVFGGALAAVLYRGGLGGLGGFGGSAPPPVAVVPAPQPAPPPLTAPVAAPAPAASTPAPAAAAPAPPAAAPAPTGAPPAAAPAAVTQAVPPPAPEQAAPAPAPEKPAEKAAARRPEVAKKAVAPKKPAKPEPRPTRRVAVAEPAPAPTPVRKPAGDPLLDVVGNDDDLTRDTGKRRSVYVPPAPGSDLPERVTDSQIIEAIVGKKAALSSCVEEQRAASADAKGPLMLRWSIAPDGGVRDVKSLSEGLGRQPIVGCISGVVRSTRFPRSRLGREVDGFPFKF